MSSFVGDFVCGTRTVVSQGFRSLPVLTASAILILGLIQGNVNFILFGVGMFTLAPLGALLVNVFTEFVFGYIPDRYFPSGIWQVKDADSATCSLFALMPSGDPAPFNVVPTYWTVMTTFFFTYVFANGLKLYKWQAHSKAPKEAVAYRKNQVLVALIMIGLLAITSVYFRFATSCETVLGLVVGVGLGGGLGYGWYEAMRSCGMGQLDDIFGIFNRILPMQSYEDHEPAACIPK